MYVLTFYSFKGGVGRSMALVNVAADLVRRGRRVLIVDFDLEAPGLHTFGYLKADRSTPGLVDFVLDYRTSAQTPDVRSYTYTVDGCDGRLLVMPAGRLNRTYGARMAQIDWQLLYREFDGFLLFEDLKEQWRQALNVDYVLIDSRTGHTDIAGICTRQLPDAVVAFFFPNDQNLDGLADVVDEIREESKTARNKEIRLHFVMSNVPNLDDEDRILEGRLQAFQKRLGSGQSTRVIHHYDSLSLLNQSVFTIERPLTRLAQEYRGLTEAIMRHNIEDPDGVRALLTGTIAQGQGTRRHGTELTDRMLDRIHQVHAASADILVGLARVRLANGTLEDAEQLYTEALAAGSEDTRTLLERGEVRRRLGRTDVAAQDALNAIRLGSVDLSQAIQALLLLRELRKDMLPQAVTALAASTLSDEDRMALCNVVFRGNREDLVYGVELLSAIKSGNTMARIELVCYLIGLGRYAIAMSAICPQRPIPTGLPVHDAFNYAMAEWAHTSVPPVDLSQRVLDCAAGSTETDANYWQCIAIAAAIAGDRERFEEAIGKARRDIRRVRRQFSAWRYLSVSREEFETDLDDMAALPDNPHLKPRFATEIAAVRGSAMLPK